MGIRTRFIINFITLRNYILWIKYKLKIARLNITSIALIIHNYSSRTIFVWEFFYANHADYYSLLCWILWLSVEELRCEGSQNYYWRGRRHIRSLSSITPRRSWRQCKIVLLVFLFRRIWFYVICSL